MRALVNLSPCNDALRREYVCLELYNGPYGNWFVVTYPCALHLLKILFTWITSNLLCAYKTIKGEQKLRGLNNWNRVEFKINPKHPPPPPAGCSISGVKTKKQKTTWLVLLPPIMDQGPSTISQMWREGYHSLFGIIFFGLHSIQNYFGTVENEKKNTSSTFRFHNFWASQN